MGQCSSGRAMSVAAAPADGAEASLLEEHTSLAGECIEVDPFVQSFALSRAQIKELHALVAAGTAPKILEKVAVGIVRSTGERTRVASQEDIVPAYLALFKRNMEGGELKYDSEEPGSVGASSQFIVSALRFAPDGKRHPGVQPPPAKGVSKGDLAVAIARMKVRLQLAYTSQAPPSDVRRGDVFAVTREQRDLLAGVGGGLPGALVAVLDKAFQDLKDLHPAAKDHGTVFLNVVANSCSGRPSDLSSVTENHLVRDLEQEAIELLRNLAICRGARSVV